MNDRFCSVLVFFNCTTAPFHQLPSADGHRALHAAGVLRLLLLSERGGCAEKQQRQQGSQIVSLRLFPISSDSSSSSSSSKSSSSSSSSRSSADSSSKDRCRRLSGRATLIATDGVAFVDGLLRSTSIAPWHFGQRPSENPPDILLINDRLPCLQPLFAGLLASRRRVWPGPGPSSEGT